MRAFLITGNPGSGKSTLAAQLSHRGEVAIDADDLASWEDSSGMPVEPPACVDEAWQLSHRWVWNRARIEAVIAACEHPSGVMFVCGIAVNQREMLDCFDLVFLLSLDDRTQIDRLDTASNAHRNEAQRAQIIRGRPVFEQEMRAAGAVVLDGRQPTSRIVDRILREVRPTSRL